MNRSVGRKVHDHETIRGRLLERAIEYWDGLVETDWVSTDLPKSYVTPVKRGRYGYEKPGYYDAKYMRGVVYLRLNYWTVALNRRAARGRAVEHVAR